MKTQSTTANLLCALAIMVSSVSAEAAAEPFKLTATTDVKTLLELGKLQQARKLASEAVQKNPNNAQAHFWYAKSLKSLGQADEAMTEFERAISLDKTLSEAMTDLADLYLQNLDQANALRLARMAVAASPKSFQARVSLISALMQSEQVSQAEKELTSLLSSQPNSADVFILAYKIRLKKGDNKGARAYLEQAIARNPSNVQWQIELSELLDTSGAHTEARNRLETILQERPNSIEARLRLARNLEVFAADYEGAIAQYKRVLDADPSSTSAITGIDRCRAKKNNLALRIKNALRSWAKAGAGK